MIDWIGRYYELTNHALAKFNVHLLKIDCNVLLPSLQLKAVGSGDGSDVAGGPINNNNNTPIINALLSRFERGSINAIYITSTHTQLQINDIMAHNSSRYGGITITLLDNHAIPFGWNHVNDSQDHDESQPTEPKQTMDEDDDNNVHYDNVFAGGFFDYLHSGHKYFLSVGALLSNHYFLVTVLQPSDTASSTKHKQHLMQPLDTRIRQVKQFMELFHPYHQHIDIVPNQRCSEIGRCPLVTRQCGPNDAILLIEESVSSGVKINDFRRRNQLAPLHVYRIQEISSGRTPMASPTTSPLSSPTKLSSSIIRTILDEEDPMA
ncbi:hypothetical protein SAMD00019534_045420 [Acytostelium subglobosum LB1]|uniref:hypothetical protein n=1 Tax=Acytostelium subglobosum LB1 TaxID=1410327 RepID=UPI000644C5EB|nr:hypothetical protein SAMD00019534_045420 [Acytostelium subglobosum LB1]GAM21367.1 hypothetical protein SAMD00019534_045420 [Acytostelium subglobosum LB1]|eukprot:XP_012755486.1 hypothetical protein SAMD00019534_045420 [Acytostelium subglobosum LB1]